MVLYRNPSPPGVKVSINKFTSNKKHKYFYVLLERLFLLTNQVFFFSRIHSRDFLRKVRHTLSLLCVLAWLYRGPLKSTLRLKFQGHHKCCSSADPMDPPENQPVISGPHQTDTFVTMSSSISKNFSYLGYNLTASLGSWSGVGGAVPPSSSPGFEPNTSALVALYARVADADGARRHTPSRLSSRCLEHFYLINIGCDGRESNLSP